MRTFAAPCATLEDVDVECTHCGIRMTAHQGSESKVRYFRCSSCHRWVSSTYAEVFEADAKVRTQPKKPEAEAPAAFDAVKDRLERWLAAVEDQDPYRILGISPMEPPDRIRAKYRELAMQFHPDRGGSLEKMREINLAYERITLHREKRRIEALRPGKEQAQKLNAGE